MKSFNQIDTNGDGRISLEEAIVYIVPNPNYVPTSSMKLLHLMLHKMDNNGNGFIEPGEFDNQLA